MVSVTYEVEERISTHPSFRFVTPVIIRMEGKEMKILKLAEETGSEKEIGEIVGDYMITR
jgi:hypothetical protein